MDIRLLVTEILGRNSSGWNESAEQIVYDNWKNNRRSLTFDEVYRNLLEQAPLGSYLYWVKYHGNNEITNFRRRLKYRYDTFKSNREIVLYLHVNNYLAGKFGSPTPNEVEQLLGKDSIWYAPRTYTDEESKVLTMFLDLENE